MSEREVLRTLTQQEMQETLGPELVAIQQGEQMVAQAKDTIGRYMQLLAGRKDVMIDLGSGELFVKPADAPAPGPPAPPMRPEMQAALNGGSMGPHGVAEDTRVYEGEDGA